MGEGAGGAHPPPGMTCGRFLINTVQSLDRHTKSALSFDMYSQQFTLCYSQSKALFFVFAFKIFYVISQLVVHPLLRKILDPPLGDYHNDNNDKNGDDKKEDYERDDNDDAAYDVILVVI